MENEYHPNRYRRIAILRALQLGDLLCTVPAVRAIRAALPDAEISLVGLPWAAEFVARFGVYFNHFSEFPGFPGLPEIEPEIAQIPDFLKTMQSERFDLSIQMQGSGSFTNPLIALFGARHTAGTMLRGEYCPEPGLFMEYLADQPEIIRMTRLVEFLGFPVESLELEFPIGERDRARAKELIEQHGLDQGDFVIVHAGARAANRRWPAENFASVADGICQLGLRVALTGSPAEKTLTQEVARRMEYPAVDLAGVTDLGSLAALIEVSRVVVCNDTGISHVADALKKSSVILFTGSDPERWAPLDQSLHRIIRGAGGVDPREVLDVVRNQLQTVSSYAA
jgi:ADP-heptose:LPS heptosyltransferase